jgi:TonB family protein
MPTSAVWKSKCIFLVRCRVTNHRSASRLFILVALLAGATHAYAQSAPPAIDPAISRLAARIAEPLQKSHAKKVVVEELKGPDGLVHPVGKYLADRLSESLQKEFPDLEIIDRSQQEANPGNNQDSGDETAAMEKTKAWARELGASFVIVGSFAKASQGVGVSLSATACNGAAKWFGQANALVPITNEIAALSSDPIPSPKNGIFRAGSGGATTPACVRCPAPEYTDKARAAQYQGVVILDAVVSADGQPEQIIALKGPGLGLEENAIKAVKKWKFKPALGPDGNPVTVIVKIEVTFHLYRRN